MDGFASFWAAYPRKVGKQAAEKEWQRQRPPLERVLATLAWQVPLWTDPQYIPHPRTWLHQGRWEDEPPAQVTPKKFRGIESWLSAQISDD